jgi:SAM-dependent methyltransferase
VGVEPIDAFALFPRMASRIAGLGQDGGDPVGDVAFHSHYLHFRPGRNQISVVFEGLRAEQGTILIMVNAMPAYDGRVARSVYTRRFALPALAADGGPIRLSFTASDRYRYAIVGTLKDQAGVSASAIRVEGSGLAGMNDPDRLQDDDLARLLQGPPAIGPIERLFASAVPQGAWVSPDRATLVDPVSQFCTSDQIDEPIYGDWLQILHQQRAYHRKQWELIYILRCLDHFGMMRPGMRGLGFGVGAEPISAVLAARGCSVVATDLDAADARASGWKATGQHGDSLAALHHPAICPADIFSERVQFRPVDMNAIPADLAGFDFCWSSCAYEHLGSIDKGLRFLEKALDCLRPGGVSVHTSEFNLSSDRRTVRKGGTVLFRRRDMERIARRLIRRGHKVLPFKYDLGTGALDHHVDMPPFTENEHLRLKIGGYATTSFGLVVIKA